MGRSGAVISGSGCQAKAVHRLPASLLQPGGEVPARSAQRTRRYTALVKQGQASVGVARQSCGQLGKTPNGQGLVSLTLARREGPVCVALRLFLPPAWAADAARRAAAGVPAAVPARPKWQGALDELDRVRAAGAGFGCVLADAEVGKAAGFRHGLEARGLRWAVGILPTQPVYPADVSAAPAPARATGRPRQHPVPSTASRSAAGPFGQRRHRGRILA